MSFIGHRPWPGCGCRQNVEPGVRRYERWVGFAVALLIIIAVAVAWVLQ